MTECVCGCGREIEDSFLTKVNFDAYVVQQELMEWDGARLMQRGLARADGPVIDDGPLDPFIDAGAAIYQTMLPVLHGEASPDALDRRRLKRWVKFSRKSRRSMGITVRREKYLDPRPEDEGKVNRLHPEVTFTGPDPDGRGLAAAAGVVSGDDGGSERGTCFCGCGRAIGPAVEGMNTNGQAAVDMLAMLRATRPALAEPDDPADGFTASLIELCDEYIEAGEGAVEQWSDLVHTGGEFLPPGDAEAFMAAFTEWGESSGWLIAVAEKLPSMTAGEKAEVAKAMRTERGRDEVTEDDSGPTLADLERKYGIAQGEGSTGSGEP